MCKKVFRVLWKCFKWYVKYDILCLAVIGVGEMLNIHNTTYNMYREGKIQKPTGERVANFTWDLTINKYKRYFGFLKKETEA